MAQTPDESDRDPVEPPTGRGRGGRGGATPSRVGSLWVASILFAVVLLLLLIFVLQNGQDAKISYLGAHGNLPQGVALLLAAVFGILLVALPGTARIIQLRIRDRRHRGAARTRPEAARPAVHGGTGSGAGAITPSTDVRPTDARASDAPPTDSPPTQTPRRDVTPPATGAPATGPLTGNAPEANAPSTNAPTSPVAPPPWPPPAQPPADSR